MNAESPKFISPSGENENDDAPVVMCPSCHGDGADDCEDCDGEGKVDCEDCSGTGEVEASTYGDSPDGTVMVNPQGNAKPQVMRTGKGQLDGVEVLADGALLFTSWADSSIHLLANGRDRPIIRGVPVAADIGIDTKRNRLAIPLSVLGTVQLWSLDGLQRPR